jgi:hypothetical protein
MSVIINMDIFILNSDIHNIHNRHGLDFHHRTYKLAEVRKGAFYCGIMVFNNLPQNVKNLSSGASKFRYALKSFFILAAFIPFEFLMENK